VFVVPDEVGKTDICGFQSHLYVRIVIIFSLSNLLPVPV